MKSNKKVIFQQFPLSFPLSKTKSHIAHIPRGYYHILNNSLVIIQFDCISLFPVPLYIDPWTGTEQRNCAFSRSWSRSEGWCCPFFVTRLCCICTVVCTYIIISNIIAFATLFSASRSHLIAEISGSSIELRFNRPLLKENITPSVTA